MTRIAVVDYGMGNRRSVEKALARVGAAPTITNDHDVIRAADGLVVPGVGAFPRAMANLAELGLDALLRERVAAGVEVKVIGKVVPPVPGIVCVKSPRLRLHVRAMVRDRKSAFVGSQSLRRPQIDGRREIGVISPHSKVASAVARVFDQDWNESIPKAAVQEKEKAAAEALEPALT